MLSFELWIIWLNKESAKWILPIQIAIMGAGIVLSIFIYKKTQQGPIGFLDLFQSGFRHFIAATLVMVMFTYINQKQHPEYAKQVALEQRVQLANTGKYTLAQLNEMTKEAEKQFITVAIYGTVFRYLILGAVFAAVSSLAFSRKR